MKKRNWMVLCAMTMFTLTSCFVPPDPVKVLSLRNNKGVSEISIGKSLIFDAFIDDERVSNSELLWQTTNEALASIDSSGNFLALQSGDVKVKASLRSDFQVCGYYAISIVIEDPEVNYIEITSSNGVSLEINEESQLSAFVFPTEIEQDVDWNTSDDDIINLTPNGKIKALALGKATISATSKVDPEAKKDIEIEVVANKGYYRNENPSGTSLQDLKNANRQQTITAVGSPKILIVPVHIRGTIEWSETMLDNINKAFFGTSEETSWESVSSFYKKSSYGKLNITGEVSPVVEVDKSLTELNAYIQQKSDSLAHTKYVARSFYNQMDASYLQDYDTNNDGYIDAAYFIYSNNYDKNDYWAWVWWMGGSEFSPSITKPTPNTHMWASYHFVYDGYGRDGIDAHTYIHETGHILGLADYYDYGTTTRSPVSPAGWIDMMDYNITDHSSYSKFVLGWKQPYYVDGTLDETKITINSFTDTGDMILVKNNWNGTALDEYLLLELYTPTGLNKKDSLDPYPSSKVQGFTIPGVRIYHIDSRVGHSVFNGSTFVYEYTNTPIANGSYDVAASNTPERSKAPNKSFKLVHLMQARGVDTLTTSNNSATNSDLFVTGKTFEASSAFFVYGSNFNNGSRVGYRITINSVSQFSSSITIRKI